MGIFDQGGCGKIEQPGRNHAAAPPHFSNIRQVQFKLEFFRTAQRRGLRVGGLARVLADIGRSQDAEALCVSRHDSVFNPVMDHLDEVTRAIASAMQVSLLRSASTFFSSGSGWDISLTRCKSSKDGIKPLHNSGLSTDHHAVTPFEAPHAAAGANIDIMNRARREVLRTANVVNIVRVAPVDENVSRVDVRQQITNGPVHHCSGDH